MKDATPTAGLLVGCVLLLGANGVGAQDWPQYRGPNRDNKVTGFTAPAAWPRDLTQKWKVSVGLGNASPALVGDRLYVFTRQGGDEVTSCLDAASGKVLWQDRYAARAVTGAAVGMAGLGGPGPRSSPAVAEGKVCTLGVAGVLSCLDAATGKVVWRKDTRAWPQFFTRSSPLITGGKCIVQLGSRGKGEISAFDLATGEAAWAWAGEGPAYGSPVLLTAGGTRQLVTLTEKSLVGVGVADGKLLWRAPFSSRFNSTSPVVDGPAVICSGPGAGTVAFRVEKKGDGFAARELWRNAHAASQSNTPVLKDGLLYGITRVGVGAGNFFCMDASTGDVLWADKTRRGDAGEVLDAGGVLLALTSDSHLVAFKPGRKVYEELARYSVADTPTFAHPVIAGKRVFVKDQGALTLWAIE